MNRLFHIKVRKADKDSVKRDQSMLLRCAQNGSNLQRKRHGHAQPSLPTITIPFADDEGTNADTGNSARKY